MNDYPKNIWTDEDMVKTKSGYFIAREVKCPVCSGQVTLQKRGHRKIS